MISLRILSVTIDVHIVWYYSLHTFPTLMWKTSYTTSDLIQFITYDHRAYSIWSKIFIMRFTLMWNTFDLIHVNLIKKMNMPYTFARLNAYWVRSAMHNYNSFMYDNYAYSIWDNSVITLHMLMWMVFHISLLWYTI